MITFLLILFLVMCDSANTKPNILFIMADDLGWGEIGAFFDTEIQTPNLDKLAKDGMRFTNAYAGYTVCAPSRTTLFTGRHVGHFAKYGYDGNDLNPGQAVTTAEVLKKAGYQTGAVGKLAPLTKPTSMGFDFFFGQVDQGSCHFMYPPKVDSGDGRNNVHLPLNDIDWHNKTRNDTMLHPEKFNYTTDLFRDQALTFLDTTSKETPFFLYLSFTVPHAGGWASAWELGQPVPTDGPYAKQDWKDVEKDHAATIWYMDAVIGVVLNKLNAMGVTDDTLVMFASDNGAHEEGGHSPAFFNSTGGLKGQKRSLYEGGVRSPSIVKWPGKVKPGSESDYQWGFWDIMPTLAEVAGASAFVPKDIDGHSIAPTLAGNNQPLPEFTFFTWGVHTAKGNFTDSGYTARVGQWKAVAPLCNNATWKPAQNDVMEIYNLQDDPFEKDNLNATKAGQTQIQKIKQLVLSKKDLSCNCYQC